MLSRKLALRPPVEQLLQQNVLHSDDVFSRTVSLKLGEFERDKKEAVLNRKLADRPSRERLVEMNLLPVPGPAPHSIGLSKEMIESQLNKKLASRPSREELVDQHKLLPGDDALHAAARAKVQRKLIETSLNHALGLKYGSRFSGSAREAEPLVRQWDARREHVATTSPSESAAASASASTCAASSDFATRSYELRDESETPPMSPTTARKVSRELKRALSSQSLLQKSQFIRALQDEGRFVCVNCCSEDFQGLELSSPRYSYKDFYNEEEWKDLGLVPSHHAAGARSKQYVSWPCV